MKYLEIRHWKTLRSGNGHVKVPVRPEDKFPAWQELTFYEQGVLQGLWRISARTGAWVPDDPAFVRRALALAPGESQRLPAALASLQRLGLLTPCDHRETPKAVNRAKPAKKPKAATVITPAAEPSITLTAPEPKPEPKPKPPALELPAWLNPEIWREFKLMRQKIRKPMTLYAEKRMVAKLAKMRERSDPNEILNQSIEHSWQGVFELREENGHGTEKKFNLERFRRGSDGDSAVIR